MKLPFLIGSIILGWSILWKATGECRPSNEPLSAAVQHHQMLRVEPLYPTKTTKWVQYADP